MDNRLSHTQPVELINIVAAFRGMHVSPAKHSYAWLPRKCDYRTDTHTDRQTDWQTDRRRTKWSLCAAMLRRRHKNQGVLVKHYAPCGNSLKRLFLARRSKSRSQGHWPCHLNGHHLLSMHAKYEASIYCGSKVIVNVEVDNRQTDKQTNKQTGQK